MEYADVTVVIGASVLGAHRGMATKVTFWRGWTSRARDWYRDLPKEQQGKWDTLQAEFERQFERRDELEYEKA